MLAASGLSWDDVGLTDAERHVAATPPPGAQEAPGAPVAPGAPGASPSAPPGTPGGPRTTEGDVAPAGEEQELDGPSVCVGGGGRHAGLEEGAPEAH
eukprot:4672157-Prymnesium_polylepis.2